MTGQLFTPGQEVVCIGKSWQAAPEVKGTSPIYGQIYTVERYFPIPIHGRWFLQLKEYPNGDCFIQEGFAPVADISDLVKETLEPIIETV